MNELNKYILNLIGGSMCVIGFGISGLVAFFVTTGIIFGYATRPTFSPDIDGLFFFIIIVLIGLLIGGIGLRIAPFGQAWLTKVENDKLIEKHKKQIAKEEYQTELEAAKAAVDGKKRSVVVMDDDAIVIESDDKENKDMYDNDIENKPDGIMDGIRLVATICMYIIGGFFLLMGLVAMVSGDILSAIIIACGGVICIPIIRDRIAIVTNTKRISGSIAIVIMIAMLFIGIGFASPISSDVLIPETTLPQSSATSIMTPNPEPNPTPTPDIITISAIKMLPLGTELGDKSGWRSKSEDDNTYNIATRKYYKDNRRVVITVNVLSDNNAARTLYYEKHNRFGYDEYPTLGVGELSLIYTMTASNSYHECSDGYFVNKNIFVEINVDDYRISDHEMCIYAKQVNRKIEI